MAPGGVLFAVILFCSLGIRHEVDGLLPIKTINTRSVSPIPWQRPYQAPYFPVQNAHPVPYEDTHGSYPPSAYPFPGQVPPPIPISMEPQQRASSNSGPSGAVEANHNPIYAYSPVQSQHYWMPGPQYNMPVPIQPQYVQPHVQIQPYDAPQSPYMRPYMPASSYHPSSPVSYNPVTSTGHTNTTGSHHNENKYTSINHKDAPTYPVLNSTSMGTSSAQKKPYANQIGGLPVAASVPSKPSHVTASICAYHGFHPIGKTFDRQYLLCLPGEGNNFNHIYLNCPSHQVFSPNFRRCVNETTVEKERKLVEAVNVEHMKRPAIYAPSYAKTPATTTQAAPKTTTKSPYAPVDKYTTTTEMPSKIYPAGDYNEVKTSPRTNSYTAASPVYMVPTTERSNYGTSAVYEERPKESFETTTSSSIYYGEITPTNEYMATVTTAYPMEYSQSGPVYSQTQDGYKTPQSTTYPSPIYPGITEYSTAYAYPSTTNSNYGISSSQYVTKSNGYDVMATTPDSSYSPTPGYSIPNYPGSVEQSTVYPSQPYTYNGIQTTYEPATNTNRYDIPETYPYPSTETTYNDTNPFASSTTTQDTSVYAKDPESYSGMGEGVPYQGTPAGYGSGISTPSNAGSSPPYDYNLGHVTYTTVTSSSTTNSYETSSQMANETGPYYNQTHAGQYSPATESSTSSYPKGPYDGDYSTPSIIGYAGTETSVAPYSTEGTIQTTSQYDSYLINDTQTTYTSTYVSPTSTSGPETITYEQNLYSSSSPSPTDSYKVTASQQPTAQTTVAYGSSTNSYEGQPTMGTTAPAYQQASTYPAGYIYSSSTYPSPMQPSMPATSTVYPSITAATATENLYSSTSASYPSPGEYSTYSPFSVSMTSTNASTTAEKSYPSTTAYAPLYTASTGTSYLSSISPTSTTSATTSTAYSTTYTASTANSYLPTISSSTSQPPPGYTSYSTSSSSPTETSTSTDSMPTTYYTPFKDSTTYSHTSTTLSSIYQSPPAVSTYSATSTSPSPTYTSTSTVSSATMPTAYSALYTASTPNSYSSTVSSSPYQSSPEYSSYSTPSSSTSPSDTSSTTESSAPTTSTAYPSTTDTSGSYTEPSRSTYPSIYSTTLSASSNYPSSTKYASYSTPSATTITSAYTGNSSPSYFTTSDAPSQSTSTAYQTSPTAYLSTSTDYASSSTVSYLPTSTENTPYANPRSGSDSNRSQDGYLLSTSTDLPSSTVPETSPQYTDYPTVTTTQSGSDLVTTTTGYSTISYTEGNTYSTMESSSTNGPEITQTTGMPSSTSAVPSYSGENSTYNYSLYSSTSETIYASSTSAMETTNPYASSSSPAYGSTEFTTQYADVTDAPASSSPSPEKSTVSSAPSTSVYVTPTYYTSTMSPSSPAPYSLTNTYSTNSTPKTYHPTRSAEGLDVGQIGFYGDREPQG